MKKCECCGETDIPADGYPVCEACSAEGYWMDPMGTIHAPGSDPARAYE